MVLKKTVKPSKFFVVSSIFILLALLPESSSNQFAAASETKKEQHTRVFRGNVTVTGLPPLHRRHSSRRSPSGLLATTAIQPTQPPAMPQSQPDPNGPPVSIRIEGNTLRERPKETYQMNDDKPQTHLQRPAEEDPGGLSIKNHPGMAGNVMLAGPDSSNQLQMRPQSPPLPPPQEQQQAPVAGGEFQPAAFNMQQVQQTPLIPPSPNIGNAPVMGNNPAVPPQAGMGEPPPMAPVQPPLPPQQPMAPPTTYRRIRPRESRESAVKKLVNLGQIILVEQENSDFLARYGLSQDYKLRYSPPPLSDPWPLPQVFEETGRLYAINPNELEWNIMGKGSACPTLTQIIDRYKTETLFISAGTLATDDAVLDPGFMYMPTDVPAHETPTTTTTEAPREERRTQKDKTTSQTSQPPKEFRVYDEELRTKTRFWVQDEQHPIESIAVNLVSNCSDWPTRDSDETYSLAINANGITVTANEVWGVLYALETLSQLIHYNGMTYLVRGASVLDWPRFRHRGLMLDSSRHFLPKSLIKHNIDAMVQNKFNVFHWHLSDDHSFPLHLNSFPNFARRAAYSPEQVYSHQDVREVIEYARVRGIRVMPEIDSPSHVFSWRHLPTDVLTRCYASDGIPTGDVGPLDPTNNRTYEVLAQILNEIAQLFPDRAFHAGGDEVPLTCWATNPDITDFRTRYKQLSPVPNQPVLRLEDLVTLYNQKLLSIIRDTRPSDEVPPQVIMWEEAYKNDWNLSKNVTLHVWISDQNLVKFLSDRGYQVLYSQCWYLNYINYGVDWIKFYRCDPSKIGQFVLIPKDTNVAGGEVCLWGEYIDETNLISTLWPRASAVAERLWSNVTVTDITYAGRRLEEHRCRMLRRGIAAAPVSGPGTCGDSAFRPSHRIRDYKLYEANHKVKSPSMGGGAGSSLGLGYNPVSANLSHAFNASGHFFTGQAHGMLSDSSWVGNGDAVAMCQRLLMSHQAQPSYNDNIFRTGIQYTVQGNFHVSVESVLQLCLILIVIIGCLLMCRGRRMGHGLKVFRPVMQRLYILCPKSVGTASSASSSPLPASRAPILPITAPTDTKKA